MIAQPCLVAGCTGIDHIATPFAEADGLLGGAASYAAIAASHFAPTRLVGIVGADFPAEFFRLYQKHGLDLTGLQTDSREKTFFWSGRYREHFAGRDTLEIRLNAFKNFSPVLPPAWRDTPFVLLGAAQPALQHHVLDQLSDGAGRPFVVADTFDLWIQSANAELLRLLRRVDLLVINEEEALLLTGEHDPFLVGPALRKMGPPVVILKRGAQGSLLFHPQGRFALPAYPVERFVDPTGAGDSYAGALIGWLAAANRTDFAALKTAVAYATAVASLTVESFGVARLSSATRSTIERRYRQLASDHRGTKANGPARRAGAVADEDMAPVCSRRG